MQSTGQTSTQAVSLVPIQGSAMMYMPIENSSCPAGGSVSERRAESSRAFQRPAIRLTGPPPAPKIARPFQGGIVDLSTLRTGFSRSFWVANTLELFERFAFYGSKAV